MSQTPQQNVQLTCSSCQQSYLIQAQFQTSPHQCPICGVMVGAPVQQTQPPQSPLQQQAGMQQAGMQQPGFPQQAGFPQQPGYAQQPGYPQQTGYPQQPGYAPQAPGAGKKGKSQTVFIIRTVVGVVALVVIVCTLIYIINKKSNPPIRKIVELGNFSIGDFNNCGPFEVKQGQTIEVTFEISTKSGQAAVFDLKNPPADGARVTESGVFSWTPPSGFETGSYDFTVHYRDPANQNSSGYSHMELVVVEK